MGSVFKWNDVELEIDLEDVEFQEKYEKAFERMEADEQKVKVIGKLSELTRAYCDLFYHLFDDIFGSGTGDKLFQGKKNSRLVEECYTAFISHCKKDVVEINKKRTASFAKFKVVSRR